MAMSESEDPVRAASWPPTPWASCASQGEHGRVASSAPWRTRIPDIRKTALEALAVTWPTTSWRNRPAPGHQPRLQRRKPGSALGRWWNPWASCSDRQAVTPLPCAGILDDEDDWVRIRAIEALGAPSRNRDRAQDLMPSVVRESQQAPGGPESRRSVGRDRRPNRVPRLARRLGQRGRSGVCSGRGRGSGGQDPGQEQGDDTLDVFPVCQVHQPLSLKKELKISDRGIRSSCGILFMNSVRHLHRRLTGNTCWRTALPTA